MKVTWDKAKRQQNLRKHGIDFAEVKTIFESYTVTFADDRFNYDKERFITLGLLKYNVVVIVHVYRDENEIRLISARKASKYEEKLYFSS